MDMRWCLAFFGMSNTVAGRHQIDLAWANHLLTAQAVAVQNFAADHPGKGLESNMWMGADLHAGWSRISRAGVIEKTPGTDLAQSALRNGAVNGNTSYIGDAGG